MTAKAGCCGPIGTRAQIIADVSAATQQAHTGLAVLYEGLAKELPEAERDALLVAASRQRRLAEESAIVTVPDGIEVKIP